MDRVFVDANVLFSAAYTPQRGVAKLWKIPHVQIVTSSYAMAEAIRNMTRKAPERLKALSDLLSVTGLAEESVDIQLPAEVRLPKKDVPILQAAIGTLAAYLITGDHHFDDYFGMTIDGVTILRPAEYLAMRQNI